MTEFTPEHLRLIADDMGLDLDRPLGEQLGGGPGNDLPRQLAALGERIDALAEAARQDRASRLADPQARERQFAEGLRDVLNRSRTRWVGEDEQGDG